MAAAVYLTARSICQVEEPCSFNALSEQETMEWVWKNRLLTEITPDDLRALCAKVKDRGAPATAIHVRDCEANLRLRHSPWREGRQPGGRYRPVLYRDIHTERPRALSPSGIRIVLREVEQTVHDLRRTGSTLLNN